MTKTEYAYLLYRAESIEKQALKAKTDGVEDFVASRVYSKLSNGLEALVSHKNDEITVLELKSGAKLSNLHPSTALLFYGTDPHQTERKILNGEAHTRFEGPRRRR